MTNWKQNIQLSDLDPDTQIELSCRTCGFGWYEQVKTLLQQEAYAFFYLDELEFCLRCRSQNCTGSVRIALSAQTETEGFQGGLA